MRSARASVAVLLASLLLTAAAAAQVPAPSGNIYGTVLDEQGSSLPEVGATLAGPGATQSATTDRKGDFHFLNLSPGAYSVAFERKGFATLHRDVGVLLGKNAVLSITMRVAEAAEEVTIHGEAPTVDSRKTETGATFGKKELQSIPTTRDPWAFVRQVPGVLVTDTNVGGDAYLWQFGFVGKGSDSGQNTFNLDGVGVTDIWGTLPVNLNFDALDDIEVATGGSDPSIATAGVTLNLVTKRGTNQILGSARVLYSDTTGWDYGAEIGGPVWKDRVWLWGAGASNVFLGQTFVAAGQPSQSKDHVVHWNAKLNAQLAPANALSFSYVNSDLVGLGDGAAPDRSQASTWDTSFTTAAYRLEDSHVFSSKLFASGYLSYLSIDGRTTPQGGVDQQTGRLDDVWLHSFLYFPRNHRPQRQAGLTSSAFFDTGNLRHELKYGFGYRSILLDSSAIWPGDQLIGSEFTPASPESLIPPNAGITRPANQRALVNSYNAYLGDTIQAGNLTANVGARFDYQQAKNLASAVPANPAYPESLPAVRYGGDSGYPITWRQFQPRVGVTLALGDDRQTLLRASYSRFGNRSNSEILSLNAFPGPAILWYGWNDRNGNHHVDPGEIDFSNLLVTENVDATDPGSSASVNRIAKDFQPSTTDEFVVGADRQILPDLSASLAYTHRSGRNLAFNPIIGTSRDSYQYLGNATGTVTASPAGNGFVLGFSVPYYGLTTCPPPCSGGLLQNRPDFTQSYDGLELQLVKRLSHGWMLRASFAYNDFRQQVGPGAIIDPNDVVGGANTSGPAVQANGNKFGAVWINSKWQFNVSGLAQLPLGIEASANVFGRQGYPILYSVVVIMNGTYNFVTENQIGRVGAYRSPPVVLLDLHVQKLFHVGIATIGPVLDCFNAANSHTVLQRQGVVGFYEANPGGASIFNQNPSFNEPAELLSSRVFRGGLQIGF